MTRFSRCTGLRSSLTIAVLSAAACFSAAGQTTTQGAISGTVFDATSAVVPGAVVVIRNDATNTELRLTTNSSGLYTAPQLPPGTYTVTISAAGFSELRSRNVIVQNNEVTEISPHLAAGEAATVVEVTAEVPVLNFGSAEFGGHLSNQEIESIPINNRRWSSLALLTPAVVNDANGFGLLSFRAISPLLNNVEIDGADDNQAFFSEERGRTRAGYSTAQVAVREFQVNTGVYSAEFGRAVGGVVNSVTKSGGNQLHGELYFYNRNSSRSAYQPLATNTTYNSTTNNYITSPYKPKDNRNQYGFGLGGPLIKDRLFFFYAFDKYARNFPGTGRANNPNAFFVAPDTAQPTGTSCGTVNQTTGAVTGVTVSAADSPACLLSQRLGTTYASAASAINSQYQALLGDLGTVPRFGDQEINTPKLDFQLSPKEHISLLYHRLRWDSPGGVQTQSTNTYAIDTFGTDFVKLDYGVAILDSQFTSRLTNELRYQYGRELNDEGRQNSSAYTNQYLTGASGVPPEVQLYTTNGFYLGAPYYGFRTAYPDERKWQIGDTATLILGKNTIKFGEDFVHNYDLQENLYEGNGYYNYGISSGNYFADLLSKKATCNAAGTGVGTTAAGFYPCYSSFAQGFGNPNFELNTQDLGAFVQDDFKATPRLTLNLGVRYDREQIPAPVAPNYAPAAVLTTNNPGGHNTFSPRLGFAWDPYGTGKTAVHGGFGFYYGRIFNSLLLNAFENSAGPNGQLAYSYTSSTIGAPLLPQVASATPPTTALGPSIEYLDKNLRTPYSEQFDLAVQQELGLKTVLSVSYVGALSRRLPNYLNLNLNPASTYTTNYTVAPSVAGQTNCGPIVCGTVIPVKIYANKKETGATTGAYNYSPLLNTQFNAVTDVVSNINANYHALTVEMQRRQDKYFAFDANYTWSHALDFNQNQATAPGTNNWFDPYGNTRANYGNSSLNVPHRVVAWALINLPGIHGNEILKQISNGWSIKPLLQVQTGLPYSANTTGNAPNQQYNTIGALEAAGSGLSGTGVSYIPQLGRNSFHLPVTVVADARVEKDFSVRQNYTLQIFAEGFNLANHDNITGVNTTAYNITTTQNANPTTLPTTQLVYAPTFQTVTTANSNYAFNTRLIQLAARFIF